MKRRRVATQGAGPNDAGNGGDDSPVCPPHPGFMFDISDPLRQEEREGRRRRGGTRGGDSGNTAVRYIHQGLEMSNAELEKAERRRNAGYF